MLTQTTMKDVQNDTSQTGRTTAILSSMNSTILANASLTQTTISTLSAEFTDAAISSENGSNVSIFFSAVSSSLSTPMTTKQILSSSAPTTARSTMTIPTTTTLKTSTPATSTLAISTAALTTSHPCE